MQGPNQQCSFLCCAACLNSLYLFPRADRALGRQLRLLDVRLTKIEAHAFGWKQESSKSQSALANQSWSLDGWYMSSGSVDPVIHVFETLQVCFLIHETLSCLIQYAYQNIINEKRLKNRSELLCLAAEQSRFHSQHQCKSAATSIMPHSLFYSHSLFKFGPTC